MTLTFFLGPLTWNRPDVVLYCIVMCPPLCNPKQMDRKLLVKEPNAQIEKKKKKKKNFFGKADSFWGFEFCWGLLNQLPCIVGELAGGGSLAVAVEDKR